MPRTAAAGSFLAEESRRKAAAAEGATVTVTRTSTENDHLPIYEDLVRECGDVVTEARLAADHVQHQAAELLTGPDAAQQAHRRDDGTGAAAGGHPEWRGPVQ